MSEILSYRDHIPQRGTCDTRVASETAVGVFEAILWERIPLVIPTGLGASLALRIDITVVLYKLKKVITLCDKRGLFCVIEVLDTTIYNCVRSFTRAQLLER